MNTQLGATFEGHKQYLQSSTVVSGQQKLKP